MRRAMNRLEDIAIKTITTVGIIPYWYMLIKIAEKTARDAERQRNTSEFLNDAFTRYERKGGLLTKGEYLEVIKLKPKQRMREKIGEIYEVDARTTNMLFLHELAIEVAGIARKNENPFFGEVHEVIAKIATIKGIPQGETEIRTMHEEALLVIESIRN